MAGEALESPIKEDCRRLVTSYLALLGSNITAAFLSFLTALLLISQLGEDGYGQWSTYLALVGGIVLLGTNWTLTGLVRFGCEELVREGSIRRSFWARTALLIISLAIVGVVVAIAGRWLGRYFGPQGQMGWTIFAGVIAGALVLHVQYTLQAAKRLTQVGLVKVVERALLLLGLAGFTWLGALDLTKVVTLFILCGLVASAGLLVLVERKVWLPVRSSTAMLKQQLAFSLPLLLLNPFCFMDSGYLDLLVLQQFVSYRDVGVYFFASQLTGLLSQLGTTASTILAPTIVTAAVTGRTDLVVRYLTGVVPQAIFLWSLLLCAVVIAAQPVLPLLLPSGSPVGLIPVFSILLISCGFAAIWQIAYSPIAHAYKWTWMAPYVVISSGAVNVVLDLLLIPRWGMEGCALATVAAYGMCALCYVRIIHWRLKIPFSVGPLAAVLPVPVTVLFFIYLQQPLMGLLALVITAYALARIFGFSHGEDWQLLKHVPLPGPMRWLLGREQGRLDR